GGGGAPGQLKKVSGEDMTRIYVDTNSSTGQDIGGIQADYMIEVTGIRGKIISSKLYSLPGKTFVKDVETGNGPNELEAGVGIDDIECNTTMTVYFESTDWRGNTDDVPYVDIIDFSLGFGTRSGGDSYIIDGSNILLNAPYTSSTPTIDGDWSAAEWADADYYVTGSMNVSTMQDGTYLYVAVNVSDDSVYSPVDYCALFFDRNHTAATPLSSDDRQFNVTNPDGTSHPIGAGREDYNGNGAVWDDTFTANTWYAQRDLDATEIVYEFQIPFVEVWGTSTPPSGNITGFAVHIYDDDGGATKDYYWGSAGVDTIDPSTWGDVVYAPEFPTPLLPILIMLGICLIVLRKRRGVSQ
ncbi:MAG: hypothetical protein KAS67_06200, partial [Thermoplasmata archaeon]|nr:hypothetical protein [Thermoplasmata archaeon]